MSLHLFPGRLQAWLATTGLTLAIGAAGGGALALAWEQTPWGLARKLDRATEGRITAEGSLATCEADTATVIRETHRWRDAYTALERDRDRLRDAAAAAVDARAAATAARCRAAFDSGYAAGLALRGTPDDPNPRPDPVSGPGGLRDDLREAWRSGS